MSTHSLSTSSPHPPSLVHLGVRLCALSALALVFGVEPCLSKESDVFKVDGRVNFEAQNDDRFESVDLDKEGVFQIETPRRKGVKAVTDVRVTSDSGGITLRELYLNFKSDSGNRLLVGLARKRFGLAWDQNMEERLTLRRGLIYRKLGELSYSGRDTTLSYRLPDPDQSQTVHEFSLHTSEGLNAAFLYQLSAKLNEFTTLGCYSLLQGSRVDLSWKPSVAQGVSLLYQKMDFRIETELFLGEDYLESQFNRKTGQGGRVYFSAWSLGASLRLPGAFKDVGPFARVSLLVHDLSRFAQRSDELTLGTRYFFHPRFYFGAEVSLIQSEFGSEPGFDSTSYFLLALRYFF